MNVKGGQKLELRVLLMPPACYYDNTNPPSARETASWSGYKFYAGGVANGPQTYYLRARHYNPVIGRFTQEDTHWNTGNGIYGDNPLEINQNDPLGLNTYTLVPNINAIRQSTNLYAYCGYNPIMYRDLGGYYWETAFDLLSLAWSYCEFYNNPTWGNAGFVLWDAGAVALPFVVGSQAVKGAKIGTQAAGIAGDAAKTAKRVDQLGEAAKAINRGQSLTADMKGALQGQARRIMNPVLTKAGVTGKTHDVHHLIPLEWAHRMGKDWNPNLRTNLAVVDRHIHHKITAEWNRFRAQHPSPTVKQIMDKVNEINRQYGAQFMR